MKPHSRRYVLVLAAAVAAGSACLPLGSPDPQRPITRVRSAALASKTPPLGAFVLRLAASEVSLDDEQARVVKELVADGEKAIGPVDEARVVFLDVLIRAVNERHYDEAAVNAARERLVIATRSAAAHLLYTLTKLHGILHPDQRGVLVARVSARFEGWREGWHGGTANQHRWLTTLAGPAFPENADMIEDAVRTAWRWAAAVSGEVRVACARDRLDDAERRALLDRLRT